MGKGKDVTDILEGQIEALAMTRDYSVSQTAHIVETKFASIFASDPNALNSGCNAKCIAYLTTNFVCICNNMHEHIKRWHIKSTLRK